MLQRCLAVKLRRCFMDEDTTSPHFFGGWTFLPGVNRVSGPQLENVYSIKHSTRWALFQRCCFDDEGVFLGKITGGCEGCSKWAPLFFFCFPLTPCVSCTSEPTISELYLVHMSWPQKQFSMAFKMTRDPCSWGLLPVLNVAAHQHDSGGVFHQLYVTLVLVVVISDPQ